MSEIQALLNGDEPEPEDMQVIYEEELLRYNPANFGEAIPPEAMDIMSGMVDPGKKVQGLMSLFKNLFKGRGLRQSEKIATKNIDESRRLVDEAAESRRSVSERTTPEGTIRIERTVNPKTGWREDKLKGGGHLYQKGYYGKRYK